MKLLVVNADDFGRTPAVNAAIAQAHSSGLLTSASLLVTAPHAAEAIAFARQHAALGVGLHLCLVDGRPAAPPAQLQPLVGPNGNLPAGPLALSTALRRGDRRAAAGAVELEARAQLDQFFASGLRPTHLDTHMHTHLDPRVLRLVARLARDYQIPYVRAAVEPLWPALCCGRQRLARRLARWLVFGVWGAAGRRQLRRAGLATADRAVGVLDPGHLTEDFLVAYLQRLPEGLTEIFCHPATAATAGPPPGQAGYESAAELRALCSARVRQLVAQQGIRLVNFRQLAQEGPVATYGAGSRVTKPV